MAERSIAHLVKYQDTRLGRQFNEHHNTEHVTCSAGCASSHVEDRGFDVSGAKDASSSGHMAWVPHLSGEAGHGAYIIRDTPKNSDRFRKNGARCAHCGGEVG